MDLIELPPHGSGPDWGADPDGGGRRRALGWAGAVIVLALVAVVALVNQHRTRSDRTSAVLPGASQPGRPQASASGGNGAGQGGSPGAGAIPQLVSCPQIVDKQSHLAYRCIDNYLVQDGSDIYLGLRIALNHEVEPGWVISEGSGDPTSIADPPNDTVLAGGHVLAEPRRGSPLAAGSPTATPSAPPTTTASAVQREVERRTELALQKAYGDNPSARTMAATQRVLSGVTGFEQLTEITINPAWRQAHQLTARTERLWVVGLPSPSGVSIFMMSIPDERKDLWPKAEATVGTVHVI